MTDDPRRRLALVAALAAALLLAPAAAAHASLLSSTPRAGEAIPEAPARVVLHFSEPLDPSFSSVRVENSQGIRLDKGDLVLEGKTASVGVPVLPKGIYHVRWQALSESDGHTTRGSTPFVVGDASLAVGLAAGAVQDAETGGLPEAAARAVSYVGYAAALGGVAFGTFVAPRLPHEATAAVRRHVRVAILAGCVVTVAGSLALLVLSAARNVDALGPATLVGFLLDARTGNLLLVRLAGAVLLGVCASGPAVGRWAGSLLLVGALAAAGHAAAVSPLYGIADAVHVAAVSAWVGGLGIVVALATRRVAGARDLVTAFTPTATVCVALLLGSGVVDLLVLDDLATLPDSTWGRQMMVKLGLVAAMLALGAVNGFVLPRRGLEAWFRRSVTGEFALGLAVLAVAGLITNGAPVYAAAAPAPVDDLARFRGEDGGLALELALGPTPLVPGLHRFDLLVREPAEGDHNITNVTLEFSLPTDRSVGKVAVALDEVSHGMQYATEGAYLTEPGVWQVDAKIRRADAYDVKVTFDVNVTEERSP